MSSLLARLVILVVVGFCAFIFGYHTGRVEEHAVMAAHEADALTAQEHKDSDALAALKRKTTAAPKPATHACPKPIPAPAAPRQCQGLFGMYNC